MPFESEEFRKNFDKYILSRRTTEKGFKIPPNLSLEEITTLLKNRRDSIRIKLGLTDNNKE